MPKLYYQNWIDKKNMTTYSLDMVRYNIEFLSIDTKNKFTEWLRELEQTASEDYVIAYHPSFKAFSYRHLWVIRTRHNNSWTMALDLTGQPNDAVKGMIEYNPNKCMQDDLFNAFWKRLSEKLLTISLVRYDVAIDIPLPRSQCRLIKEGKKMYQLIEKDDGITEYLGQRSHSGFVKLYDKTIESDLDYALTRLEITLDANTSLVDVFPKVHIYDTQATLIFNDDLCENDKVLISLLRACDDKMFYLKSLSYRKRKKIEPYLADRVLQCDLKCFQYVRSFAISPCK